MKPKNHTEDCSCDHCDLARRFEVVDAVNHMAAQWLDREHLWRVSVDLYARDERLASYALVMARRAELVAAERCLMDAVHAARAAHRRDCPRCFPSEEG